MQLTFTNSKSEIDVFVDGIGDKDMQKFTYIVTDSIGIHVRLAGRLARKVKNYTSSVMIKKGVKTGDAKKIMMLVALGIKCGDEITVEVTGVDEATVTSELEEFFKENI